MLQALNKVVPPLQVAEMKWPLIDAVAATAPATGNVRRVGQVIKCH